MEITHYLYDSLVIAADGLRVAVDPGGELYHISFGPIRKTLHPGPKERIGYGAAGFSLEMEVTEALRPRLVIPCHHNLPSFFKKNANPTDVRSFVETIEAIGIECRDLSRAETVVV